MTKDETLKLALEAFEWNYNTDLDNISACEQWAKMLKANITAIKEALANVATNDTSKECVDEMQKQRHEPCPFVVSTKEGTHHCALSHREPLTDEEIDAVTDLQWAKGVNKPIYAAHRAYARAIEAKLKEKNT